MRLDCVGNGAGSGHFGALGACRGLGILGAYRPLRISANRVFERLQERVEMEGLQMKGWDMERLWGGSSSGGVCWGKLEYGVSVNPYFPSTLQRRRDIKKFNLIEKSRSSQVKLVKVNQTTFWFGVF